MKCENCFVIAEAKESDEPCCCAWYLDHVVFLGENVDNCPIYRKDKSVNNDAET